MECAILAVLDALKVSTVRQWPLLSAVDYVNLWKHRQSVSTDGVQQSGLVVINHIVFYQFLLNEQYYASPDKGISVVSVSSVDWLTKFQYKLLPSRCDKIPRRTEPNRPPRDGFTDCASFLARPLGANFSHIPGRKTCILNPLYSIVNRNSQRDA